MSFIRTWTPPQSRSFKEYGMKQYGYKAHDTPKPGIGNKRRQRHGNWFNGRLNYEFLNRCKETVCRIIHPSSFHKKWYYKNGSHTEVRLSILPWSNGAYLDIRKYFRGGAQPVGILLHLDIMSAILPEIIAAVRRMESEDTREPNQKCKIVFLPLEGDDGENVDREVETGSYVGQEV